MKTALIFATLLIFVYSDDSGYPSNLPKEFNELKELQKKCSEAEEEEEKCLSETLSNSNYKCCMMTVEYPENKNDEDNNDSKICTIMIKDIKYFQEAYNNAMFKAQLREIFGYIRHGIYFIQDDGQKHYIADDMSFKMKQTYKCNDGIAEYKYGYDVYSPSDIAVYDSGSHCLKYFYRYLYGENYDENLELTPVSKEDCQNAQLTQGAKDDGIKCGFYQFTVNYLQGGSKTYSTCYIYNANIISEGKLDEKTQSELQLFVSQVDAREGDGGTFTTYTTKFSDESGNSYTFDMTGAISKQSSSKLIMTKYLYLLFVLFML